LAIVIVAPIEIVLAHIDANSEQGVRVEKS